MAMDVSIGKNKGKKKSAVPEMNVTPLVDVVLVLLIIFMVITPLLSKQFWVHVPATVETEEMADPRDQPLILSLAQDGTIRLNNETVGQTQLKAKLETVLKERGDGKVFFNGAQKASYGLSLQLMDTARAAGAKTITVLTEEVLAH